MKLFITICAILVFAFGVVAQQQPDPEFNTTVENPAYKKEGPRVMFDEAHHNFHTERHKVYRTCPAKQF